MIKMKHIPKEDTFHSGHLPVEPLATDVLCPESKRPKVLSRVKTSMARYVYSSKEFGLTDRRLGSSIKLQAQASRWQLAESLDIGRSRSVPPVPPVPKKVKNENSDIRLTGTPAHPLVLPSAVSPLHLRAFVYRKCGGISAALLSLMKILKL